MKYFVYLIFFFNIASSLASPDRLRFLLDQLISEDSSYKVKIAAASELGQISNGSLILPLTDAFTDESHDAVRLSILDAIANIPDQETLPALLYLNFHELLSSKEQLLIQKLVWNHRDHFTTSQWAYHALSSPFDKQRALAYWVLGTVGTQDILPILIKGLEDESSLVQKRILSLLPHFPTITSKKGCEKFLKNHAGSTKSMASLCLSLIKSRQKKSYKPVFRTPSTKEPIINIAISPDVIGDYFKKNQSNMVADRAFPTFNFNTKTTKRVSHSHKKQIANTIIQSNLNAPKDFRNEDIKVIQAFIYTKLPLIQHCYKRELKTAPTLKGSITISFEIQSDGTLRNTKTSAQTLESPNVENCVVKRFKELHFPKVNQASVEGTYQFHFAPPEKQFYKF